MPQQNKFPLNNFSEAVQYEWLETNGLGGMASSSIVGCNTRRYHGLLVAATVPPAERTSLVSKLDETLVINNERFELATNNYGNAIAPKGYEYIINFEKNLCPEWTYEVNGITLKKSIVMIHGENTTVIIYEIIKSPQPFALELLPLVSARNYHSLQQHYHNMFWDASFDNGLFKTQPNENTPAIYILVPGANYEHHPRWFYNFNYAVEQYRGLDYIEDLFNHGHFSTQLKEGDSFGIIISTENPTNKDAYKLFDKEILRRKGLIKSQPSNNTLNQLILAADQFIVNRGDDLKTIIAGYPWFADWGRDTMISLPGLCLSTGRFDDAKKILAAFSKAVDKGMLPNRFQDNGEAPEYNNVDGTLWYFISVYKYLQATGDEDFVLNEILPVLKEIIHWHYKGTRYNIHVTEDELLFAGEEGFQLTWMDARIGNWVVTPRRGKAVEIQALWYNALLIFSELLQLNGESVDAKRYQANASKTKDIFNKLFWFKEGGFLYDLIDENGNADATLRPNQLFAISLPFALIEGDEAANILRIVEEKLYTPVGLRTLPSSDTHYVPVYGGDAYHRDSSYHEGTVWSWLLGAYVDAIMRVSSFKAQDGLSGKEKAAKIIEDFSYHLNEGCIGTVSEIFDAGPPHHPRGCFAQAWGVAEILRVINDHKLIKKKSTKRKLKNVAEEVI